jgi:hypothetical protein
MFDAFIVGAKTFPANVVPGLATSASTCSISPDILIPVVVFEALFGKIETLFSSLPSTIPL